MCEYVINSHLTRNTPIIREQGAVSPRQFHRQLPGYLPTPLISLPGLADRLGMGRILVKDEAHRFELGAFKVLGASHAIFRWLKSMWENEVGTSFTVSDFLNFKTASRPFIVPPVCTATDGNHGRAVARAARLVGLKAVIYMPHETVAARIENIRREGADVVIVDGTYDDAVERVKEDAEKNGWQIISDTSWPGYTQIPTWIQQGYSTMFDEVEAQVTESAVPRPDIIFIQGGVGALAAAAVDYGASLSSEKRPVAVCVEPTAAACLLESARSPDGTPVSAAGNLSTIMAGLNCGTPSFTAWPIICNGIDVFLSISDRYATRAMKTYFYPHKDDARIVSGESGAAGLGALLAILESASLAEVRRHLNLGAESDILLLNTEGATDPEGFERIVGTQP